MSNLAILWIRWRTTMPRPWANFSRRALWYWVATVLGWLSRLRWPIDYGGLGREVGPLLMIDGVPENTGVALSRWGLRYWLELARNARGWVSHGDLMRSRTLHSLLWSITNNATAIGKGAIGLKRGQKLGGGYAIEGIMDVSRYPPAHKSFVNRLFQALFDYSPKSYSGDVVVYEATVKPLLHLPEIGRKWRQFAPQSEIVEIIGTHISMMHEPYVGALAKDIQRRLTGFFSAHSIS